MPPLPTALTKRVVIGLLALSTSGAAAIALYEGTKNTAYVDPVGVVTVCTGHTKTAKIGTTLTDAQCADLLRQDVSATATAMKRLVKVPLTQKQYDALLSFTFNVGEGNLAKSRLLAYVNSNQCWEAGKEFSKWTYADGKKLAGLVTRRASERKQWETGCPMGNYKT